MPPGGRVEPLRGVRGPGTGRGLVVGHGGVVDYGTPLVDDPERTSQVDDLGTDEVSFLRANARRHTTFATNFVGPPPGPASRRRGWSQRQGGRRLAVHLRRRVAGWHRHGGDRPPSPATPPGWPPTSATPAWSWTRSTRWRWPTGPSTKCAGASSRTGLGHRGRSGDPLYGIRRLLLRAGETLSEPARGRLEIGLASGDPRDEVLDAWLAKEALRAMYAAATYAEASTRFDAFVAECKGSRVPELHSLARTALRWRTQILAYHLTGASNGRTEAVNLVVKKVQRVAHGFRNFANYRLRVLLHCCVSNGDSAPPHDSEAAPPAWWRRARYVRAEGRARSPNALRAQRPASTAALGDVAAPLSTLRGHARYERCRVLRSFGRGDHRTHGGEAKPGTRGLLPRHPPGDPARPGYTRQQAKGVAPRRRSVRHWSPRCLPLGGCRGSHGRSVRIGQATGNSRKILEAIQRTTPTLAIELAVAAPQVDRVAVLRRAVVEHFFDQVSNHGAKAVSATVQRMGKSSNAFWDAIEAAGEANPHQRFDEWTDKRHAIVHRGQRPTVNREPARTCVKLVDSEAKTEAVA